MAISFNDNIKSQTNRPLDAKFGPFISIEQANSMIPIEQRYPGLVVGIISGSDVLKYEYRGSLDNSSAIQVLTLSLTEYQKVVDLPSSFTGNHSQLILNDGTNPHSTTKSDVGLSNVDNTSDEDKPISTLQQAALNNKADLVGGIVPAEQLAGYIDEVIELISFVSDNPTSGMTVDNKYYNTTTNEIFTATSATTGVSSTPEASKIYLRLENNTSYRWSGSILVALSGGITIGETSTSAYRGDRGKIAYDHTSLVTNPHNVTKTQVGLSNVDNTSDVNKPISTATQTALNGKENSFSKNTAFNKNFGTGSDTVTEGNDSRLSNVREWSASTVTQGDAETGTSTTRFAWTPQRVFQAIASWWAGSSAKTKLDGIEDGAEVNTVNPSDIANFETTTQLNARDVANRNRTNHTGTQAISTVSGLQTALDGKQATLVSATNIKTINGSSIVGAGDLPINTSPLTDQSDHLRTPKPIRESPYGVDDQYIKTGEIFETNETQFAEDGEGNIILRTPFVSTTGTTISFSVNNIIGSKDSPIESSSLAYADDLSESLILNRCIVFSKSTTVPDVLYDGRTIVEGASYDTDSNIMNILTFEYISPDDIICTNRTIVINQVNTVTILGEGTSTSSGTEKTYQINLTGSEEGNLMVIAIYNQLSMTVTPPSGWDVIHTGQPANIYARVRQAGDANTFNFVTNNTNRVGIFSMWMTNVDYTGVSSLTKGTASSITFSNTGSVSSITVLESSLVFAFIATSGQDDAPEITSPLDMTTVALNYETNSNFRCIGVFSKTYPFGATESVSYKAPATDNTNHSGILIGFYS